MTLDHLELKWQRQSTTPNYHHFHPLFFGFIGPHDLFGFFVPMIRDRDHASFCFIVIQKDLCWKSKSKCLGRPRELPLCSARQLFEWLDTAMFTFFSGSQLVPLAAGMQLTWCWNCNWPVTTKWAPKTIWMAKNQWITGAFFTLLLGGLQLHL